MVPTHLPKESTTAKDALVPSVLTIKTLSTLGLMETYMALEDIFLPYPESPLFFGLALLRDTTMLEDISTSVFQELSYLHTSGRIGLVLMAPPFQKKEFSDSVESDEPVPPSSHGESQAQTGNP